MIANVLPIAILFVLLLFIFYFIAVYNQLVKKSINIQEAWSQIDVQLKRRIDLIPNLVETVKGYADHESKVFQDVTEARAALMGAGSAEAAGKADNMLTDALKSLFAVAEAYPQLQAQENFLNLQNELSDTEDKVSYSRQFYNNTVREYNHILSVFPNNLFASPFGFKKADFFEVNESEREVPDVSFNKESEEASSTTQQ